MGFHGGPAATCRDLGNGMLSTMWLKLQTDSDTISSYRFCGMRVAFCHLLRPKKYKPGLTIPQDSRYWSWIPETVQASAVAGLWVPASGPG